MNALLTAWAYWRIGECRWWEMPRIYFETRRVDRWWYDTVNALTDEQRTRLIGKETK